MNNSFKHIIGSHAALTCHIVVMRHLITGVVSVGYFDNFCCWQFGDDSSAHRDGINSMLEEIGNFHFFLYNKLGSQKTFHQSKS